MDGTTIWVEGSVVASGSASVPVLLALGANRVTIEVGGNGRTRAYDVDVTRGADVVAYLKASNTGAWDRFGNALTLAGDTLVVGAVGESSGATGVNGEREQGDNSAAGSGAVYVWHLVR